MIPSNLLSAVSRVRASTVPAACALVAFLLLSASPQMANAENPDLLWVAQGVENVVCLEAIEDIDGDGGPDIVFESYDSGAPATNHLFCIRGASVGAGHVIWSARPLGGPSNSGGYGDNCVRIAPDMTGDGVSDVVYGSAWGGRSAFLLDGTDGSTVWSFDTYSDSPPTPPESGWVYAIDAVDDFTGDGVDEVAFCTGSYNRRVYMMNGATGAVIWNYYIPGPWYDLRFVGDVDGDHLPDVVAGSGDGENHLVCFSGPGIAGQPDLIWNLPYTDTVQSIQAMPDVDGDGLGEIVVGAWDGFVRCHDGATGASHWVSPYLAMVVMRVAVIDDVNGDGLRDVVAGQWDNKVDVLSGRDGTILWTQTVGTLNGGDTWAVDGAGDVNNDGIGEVAVGSFDTKMYLMDGASGAILWDYTTGNRLQTIRGVPDLNGNGAPDVVGGTQMLSGNGGRTYALDGRPPSMAINANDIAPGSSGLWCGPCPWSAHVPLTWLANVPRAGRFQLQLIGVDGRVLELPADRTATGAETVQGELRLAHVPQAGFRGGVVWLRALVDGDLIGSKRVVIFD